MFEVSIWKGLFYPQESLFYLSLGWYICELGLLLLIPFFTALKSLQYSTYFDINVGNCNLDSIVILKDRQYIYYIIGIHTSLSISQ